MILKKRFPEKEYHVPFFDEQGYIRKLCPKCRKHYWTIDPDRSTCGEATPQMCSLLSFIENPPTKRAYKLEEMREAFLTFFEKRGHVRMKPYPVVARWRDDLYLTSASIVDFQPYVTNGISPPPANPLVISQPCIRLVDIENTGPTFGRHLTIFEMGGHHAFNYPDERVYWKDKTVKLHHEFTTQKIGIPCEDVIYKEDIWSGGGNAGPDLETIVQGLELATLVFMQFKISDKKLVKIPIQTVDTGYGIERFTWISQGTPSGFHAVYGEILEEIFNLADIAVDPLVLSEAARYSAALNQDTHLMWNKLADAVGLSLKKLSEILTPIEKAFAVTDHTKSLVFMLAEGVVPSNAREGYLTRLMIRRTYRLLESLGIERDLEHIVNMQISRWSLDFPYLKMMSEEILTMLSIERQKMQRTLRRGEALVERILHDLRSKRINMVPISTLVKLYESHGLPPEIVRESAAKQGLDVSIPQDFYRRITQRHIKVAPKTASRIDSRLELVSNLPDTRRLYYENAYLAEFQSEVLKVLDGDQVILRETIFYPEGGGQPSDRGFLEFDGKQAEITAVQNLGKVVTHLVKGAPPQEGEKVRGKIDWSRRSYLMKAHTATHLVMGAARRVLGQHVWQTGTQKDVEQTRLDISHYARLTPDQINKIEALVNQAVTDTIPVEISWLPREKAEAKYGFRLYQGGAVPGKMIRVVKIGDWEVEACAGSHVKKTGEIGFIKIHHTERIQDGVERIIYSTGKYAVKISQDRESILQQLSETLDAPTEKLVATTQRLLREWKKAKREKERLQNMLARTESTLRKEKVGKFTILSGVLDWTSDEKGIVSTCNEFVKKGGLNSIAIVGGVVGVNARIVVSASSKAVQSGINAREIAMEVGPILGGGGSGSQNFAQAGGPLKEKLGDAIEAAKSHIQRSNRIHNR